MKNINIGEAELEIMKVVWEADESKRAHCLPKGGARRGITHRF